jgi:hypothetical protein
VGKKCFNCKHFYEEKIHQYPEFINNGESYTDFVQKFDDFIEWLDHLKTIRVLCEGRIASIKPNLSIDNYDNKQRVHAHGFLITFFTGYIDNVPFADPFYLSISSLTQNKIKLRKDDLLEFEANLTIDNGRLIFIKSGKFHFIERGLEKAPDRGKILAMVNSATIQQDQPSKCVSCSQGVLTDHKRKSSGRNRSIICLQGIPDYRICTYQDHTFNDDSNDACANPDWNGKKCSFTI